MDGSPTGPGTDVVKYRTIVADPPWHYEGTATMPGDARKSGHTTKREPLPYETLSPEEIAALPVHELAERDCALWLWTTNRYLQDAFAVLGVWGFTYRQTLVWHKTGNPSPFGGTVAPNHAEYLLLASRGRPQFAGRLPGSVIPLPKPYEHSRKPDAFLDMVQRVSPGPYVELFARRARFGWDYWGNESLQTAELVA
jgi:N6-adenosine-specific RNA methylase IME4